MPDAYIASILRTRLNTLCPRVPAGSKTDWRSGSFLEEGTFELQISWTYWTHEEDPTPHRRVVEAVPRGRKVFVQMLDDILFCKVGDECVREAEARATHVRAVHVAPVGKWKRVNCYWQQKSQRTPDSSLLRHENYRRSRMAEAMTPIHGVWLKVASDRLVTVTRSA